MGLDAIIIAANEDTSLSGSSPFKLSLDGRIADIQVVLNYIKNQGKIVLPIDGDEEMNWSLAPHLNGIYLFSYLSRYHFNLGLINNYHKERDTFIKLLQDSPRVVIISTTFIYTKSQLHELIRDIRSLAPDIFIIAGGAFVYQSYLIFKRSYEENYANKDLKNDFLFFNRNEPTVNLYIISPHGEKILSSALHDICKKQKINELPNSAFLVGNNYQFSSQIDDISASEEIAIDWKVLPDYLFKSGVMSLQASTGCPYKCAFCNFNKDRRLLRVKPIKQLIDEIKIIAGRGIKYIWFVDDNFRLGKNDINSFCKHILDENIQIRWMSFIRADTLLNTDIELLHKAGCKEVQLGLESADSQILKNMNKKTDPLIYAKVIKKLLSAGIDCSCYFISGFPGETEETIERTKTFIKTIEYPELNGALSWSIYPFMLVPLSPVYETEMRKKYKLTGYMNDWKHETMDSQQVRNNIKKIFLEIEKSGPIYRGDNLEILSQLTSEQRKQFIVKRHELSHLAVRSELKTLDILNSFSPLLANVL
jgi:anaerobic magnesium-protoporphyrin IX monomethyl ester cyclase